jgi:TetR/AcrR family transcriptional regulator
MAPRVVATRPVIEVRTDPLTARSRDRILTAALDEFANRGFDGTTTAEIARRAGVTQPLVHYHFATKEALWQEAVTSAFAGWLDTFEGVAGELADLGIIDQMKVLVRRFVRFSAAHPEMGRIISYEGVRGGPAWTGCSSTI